MNILGLSFFYHDSAAALLQDGVMVAAAEEERFSRKKHDNGFPKGAIAYCLEAGGIKVDDIDYITFYEKPFQKFDRILRTYITTFPWSARSFLRALPLWLRERLWIRNKIMDDIGLSPSNTKTKILYSEHHLSHAASAYLCSPFDEAAVLTLDGVGEWTTTGIGYGKDNKVRLDKEIRFPHSIGLLYSAMTAFLGFEVNDAEWKVMGLAPYGDPRFVDKMRPLIDVKDDGSFRLDLQFFSHHYSSVRAFTDRMAEQLGVPARDPESNIDQVHMDLAASIQRLTEEILLKLANATYEKYKVPNLCIAGGVGLNSVANWKIQNETPFENVWIQPAAGDDGGALGAALYVWNHVLGNEKRWRMTNAYLGPAFGADACRAAIEENGVPYDEYENDDDLYTAIVEALRAGDVIGWYSGRMEFGPRALGCRSIIGDPTREDMKDIINAKIKFRERFRPFAPSVMKDKAHEWFDMPEGFDCPYMLMVPQVKPDKREKIPAVTHVDGSGRVQTVEEEINPRYYGLIKKFYEKTGVPVILNTSFNVRGEPIVCTPQDAFRTFCNTGIDKLILGNFIVSTKPEGSVLGGPVAYKVREDAELFLVT